MKRLATISTVLALVLAAPMALAQTAEKPRQVTVIGDAEVRVAPDRAVIVLGMVSDSRDLAKAQSENAEKISQALAMLARQGIEKRHVQTDFLRVEPRFEKNYGTGPASYLVRRDIVVTVTDLAKLETLIEEALKLGINSASRFTLQTSELRKHRDAARLLAVQAAKEKAALLAQALGASIGPVQAIQEYGVPAPMGTRYGGAQNVSQEAAGGDAQPVFSGGEIAVRASVSVSFALQ